MTWLYTYYANWHVRIYCSTHMISYWWINNIIVLLYTLKATLPLVHVCGVINTSLVPSPKSPRGEGSGDIGTVSWLYRRVISCQYYAINQVPIPRCYAMQCTIKELRSHWLALNRQLTLHNCCCVTRCKVT